MTQVKEESFEITQLTPGMSGVDVEPGDDLVEWDDLFRYKVPIGFSYVVKPIDFFSAYLQYLQEGVGGCVSDDGGTQTNETVDANNATVNDVVLLPAVMTAGDALYIGYRHPFNLTVVKYSTRGDGVGTVTWEYWNGTAWVALLGVVDGTSNFSAAAGTYNISWAIPADWAKTTVLGFNFYWVRGRVSAVTGAGTAATLGDQIWIYTVASEVRAIDRVRVQVRDASEEGRRTIFGPLQYAQIKDFQDITKFAHPDIEREIVLPEDHWLVIEVRSTAGVIDASDCYFKLSCKRIRHTLFEEKLPLPGKEKRVEEFKRKHKIWASR